jgi:hypothetical protein
MLSKTGVWIFCAMFLASSSLDLAKTKDLLSLGDPLMALNARAGTGDANQEKTEAERLAEKLSLLKGEKVTILGAEPVLCPTARKDGAPFRLYAFDDLKREKRLSMNQYAGQSGVVLEASPTPGRGHSMEIVIQFEKSGEKIIAVGGEGLGFQSELEAARALVGRPLWSRSEYNEISTTTDPCHYFRSEERLRLKKLQKVTVTRVEFGDESHPLFIYARTEGGREGPVYSVSEGLHFDSKFHGLGGYGRPYTEIFSLEDPRKAHPGWSEAIWKLIEEGEVAVGMSEEMVKLACVSSMVRGELVKAGFVISATGNEVSTIYKCSDKKFIIEKGKVTRYVSER